MSADLEAIRARFEKLAPHLLQADQDPLRHYRGLKSEEQARASLEALLSVLTLCEPGRVKLSNASASGDPLGSEVRIRVWTLGGSYPRQEISAAEENIRQLESIVGPGPPEGYDVLATPGQGSEVLPGQRKLPWAGGAYYLQDRYCTVKSSFRPWWRQEVLKHELIHALTRHRFKSWGIPRFITEGLAEYLRFLEAGDRRLQVPPDRFRDELARLKLELEALRARGAGMDFLVPSRLLTLSPDEFYALRELSYLLALASMAYIGSGPIEDAFEAGVEEPIVKAVERIRWPALVAFIEYHSRGGFPGRAITVMDAPPEQGDPSLSMGDPQAALRQALAALGVGLPVDLKIEPKLLDLKPEENLPDRDHIAAVLDLLLAHRDSLVFLCDRSDALLGAFQLAAGDGPASSITALRDLRSADRAGFAANLYRAFLDGSRGRPIRLAGLVDPPAEFDGSQFHAGLPYSAASLRPWLAALNLPELYLVVCVAGKDERARRELQSPRKERLGETRMREELAAYYRGRLEKVQASLAAALIIDLSNGEGDALPLAVALAATQDFEGAIAYWNPQG